MSPVIQYMSPRQFWLQQVKAGALKEFETTFVNFFSDDVYKEDARAELEQCLSNGTKLEEVPRWVETLIRKSGQWKYYTALRQPSLAHLSTSG